jgi:hypothetical protein
MRTIDRRTLSLLHRILGRARVIEKGFTGEYWREVFDHNDALESHMAASVANQVSDESWAELKPQIQANDNGNSHSRVLDVYMRMLAEYRRIMDSRRRGLDRYYLLAPGELQQIADARVHPSNRKLRPDGGASEL